MDKKAGKKLGDYFYRLKRGGQAGKRSRASGTLSASRISKEIRQGDYLLGLKSAGQGMSHTEA
ncbi:Hypothetical protein DEACI_1590 [Acididesulfobacillus acetoxydans]|uniref:Uncharacterized protein n=1 Tax=Acididesulfobacillus acetoxydans TaxID=1561005 RepID=A0A8S0XWC4_9FIRM|nr:Hypothetical protein DEACI_1590 [Acididesulfobacillus acetoxydans]